MYYLFLHISSLSFSLPSLISPFPLPVQTLTRTLAVAFPELLKFLLCGSVLFLAFALCGWIVLGPFHPKVGHRPYRDSNTSNM